MLVFPREIPLKADHPVAKLVNSTTAKLKIQLADKPVGICRGMKDSSSASRSSTSDRHLRLESRFGALT